MEDEINLKEKIMPYSKEHQEELYKRYIEDELMQKIHQDIKNNHNLIKKLNAGEQISFPSYFSNEDKLIFSTASNLYDIPPDNTEILRYMDFNKFSDLINNECLWMSAPNKFNQDKQEGILIREVKAYIDDVIYSYYKRIKTAGFVLNKRFSGVPLTGNEKDDLERLYNRFMNVYEHNRKRFYISCWTTDCYDKDLMWSRYTKPPEAIAIKTTVGNLKKSIKCKRCFAVTKVRYKTPPHIGIEDFNFIKGVWSVNCYMLTLKRAYFSGDQEIRLITDNLMTQHNGIRME